MLAPVEIDERVAALTDHKFDLPCDGRPTVEDCGRAAKYAGLYSCGHDRLWCDGHHFAAIVTEKLHPPLWCGTCPDDAAGVHIVHIERIS
jgi:hypothetical protein